MAVFNRKDPKTGAAKIQQRRPKSLIRKGLPESLPTSVQKSHFLLGAKERDVLNRALEKYRPGRSEPILVGGERLLKPALKLMSLYRLQIDEISGDAVVTSYTRWLESKKRLPEYLAKEPANIGLRSHYLIRLYALAKKYVSDGKKRGSLEDLRKVLGLESVKDAEGSVIQEPPLPVWASFRRRSLDVAINGDQP